MERKQNKPSASVSIVGQIVLAVVKGKIKILNHKSKSKTNGWPLLKNFEGKSISSYLKKGGTINHLEYHLYYGFLTVEIDEVPAPRIQHKKRTLEG